MTSCPQCHSEFTKKNHYHMFCSYTCKDQYNKGKTWVGYFKKLLNNNAKERKKLDADMLFKKYTVQGGRCAISGVQLTKIVGQGPITTNASIDRIEAGGKYVESNIRLVCCFINSWRGKVTDEELIWWCQQIVEKEDTWILGKSGIIRRSMRNIKALLSRKAAGLLEAVRDIKWRRRE